MATILKPQISHSPSLTLHDSSETGKKLTRRELKQYRKEKKLRRDITRTSSPTPLLINQKPHLYTKLQALDGVIKDLESSINKGVRIDAQIFASLLETCYQLDALDRGIKVHQLIPINLLRRIIGKLMRLYSSSGYMDEAHQVFDEMLKRDESAFPWNSLIAGYAELGCYEDAMALYFQTEEEGVEPDEFTFPRVLKACAGIQ